jgi:AraC-like DNA-binding protein
MGKYLDPRADLTFRKVFGRHKDLVVKLKSYTGKSSQDFIRVIRHERAATLLRNGRSVTDTAPFAGFDNAKYSSTVFKKYFGVSPQNTPNVV